MDSSEDGETQLEVRIDQETVWLNAYQIAELFGRDSKTIRKHIANAIKEELAGEVVVANFATTTEYGAIKGKSQTHDVRFYNLDVIISVGYRVKSKKWCGLSLMGKQGAERIFNKRLCRQ